MLNSTPGNEWLLAEMGEDTLLLARASLAIFHGITLLTLTFYAYIMRVKIELKHPVFAVIFQEIIVLFVCELVSFLSVLSSGIDYSVGAYYLPLTVQLMGHLFHQWSWFTITCLRYYLLVRASPGQDVDMNRLRRRSLAFPWLSSLGYLLALYGTILAANGGRLMYRPGGNYWRLSTRQRLAVAGAFALATNFPVLASMGIYLAMRRHFGRQQQQQPSSNQVDVAAASVEDNNSIFPADSVEEKEEEEEGGEGGKQQGTEVQPKVLEGQEHEAKRVMRILRLHLALSALDVLSAINLLIPSQALRLIFGYHLGVMLAFWVPLVVIKANFKQMDDMMDTFCLTVC